MLGPERSDRHSSVLQTGVFPTRHTSDNAFSRGHYSKRWRCHATVPDALVNQVLTAAIHGPSGSNTQPWHFIVIRDPRVKNAISEVYEEARAAAGATLPSAGGVRQPLAAAPVTMR